MIEIQQILAEYYAYILMFGIFYSLSILYLFRDYKKKGAIKWFVSAIVLVGVWFSLEGVVFLIENKIISHFGLYFLRIIGASSSLFIFFFIIEYTEGVDIDYQKALIISSPLLITHLLAIITGSTIFSEVTMHGKYAEWEFNIFGQIHYYYIVFIHIVAIGQISLKAIFNRGIKRKQTLILLVGYFGAVFSALIQELIEVPPYLNITLFAVCVSLLVYGYGIKKYGLFTINPVRDSELISEIDEGVISVNSKNLVSGYNSQARNILECEFHSSTHFSNILDVYPQLENLQNSHNKTELIETKKGTYKVTSYIPSNEVTVLVIRDNTKLYEEREKLDLIRKIHTRIFRHNLRNTMSVISSYSDLIQRQSEDKSVKSSAEKIEEASEEILDLNDKTSTINDVIEDLYHTEVYNLEAVVDNQIKKLNDEFDHNNYSINKNGPSYLEAEVHYMYPIAVFNALENCIEHNSDPEINITWEKEKDQLIFKITDDGVGMSEQEYEPINSGDIDPMNHASRSGLWLIKWIIEYSSPDGVLRIESSDSGTTYRFELKSSD